MLQALRLSPETTSAAVARDFVAGALHGEPACETAVLLVSELASNAILHARTDLLVTVLVEPDCVRVSVEDASLQQPVMRPYDLGAVTGRGLQIIDRAAARWGVDPLPSGKRVWFELTNHDGRAWPR